MSGWKRVLIDTVRRYRRGLHGLESSPDPRTREMMREVTAMERRLARADSERERILAAIREQRTEEESARRRGELARNAGDHETERIAGEFAAGHARHAAVLQKKLDALEAECGWLADELRAMRRALEPHL